jgi:glycosyltransferase involved in cell wall biosynthesis
MICMDVTSAAATPVNMGVQRTVRGLYVHLNARHPVMPLRWDFRGRCYARLSPREDLFLNHPFAAYREATGTPGRWDWRHWLDAWKDTRTRSTRRIDLRELLRTGSTLIIPDLCWDARIHAWAGLTELPGRTVAIFHDAMPLRLPGQADSHDRLFAEYVRQLAQLNLVICISREVEDDLLRYWKEFDVAPKPTCVLPWPVPFDEARPETKPNFDARRIIYVSRLKLRKNHLVLFDACEKLWQRGETFFLDLIGIEDAWSDTRKILRRLRELAAKGRPVRWRQHISDAELTEAYRACSFTVFPSRLEGFGLPIVESLWHGRPVVCGRNGAIGEVATGGGCLIIDQNNADELAQAMSTLLHDGKLYDQLYAEAHQRSFRTWNDYGRDLDDVLAAAGTS